MYYMVLTNAWRNYHVMSPNLLLLDQPSPLPEFSIHGIANEAEAWAVREKMTDAKAVICDTECWPYFRDMDIPKILISVDAHALYTETYKKALETFEWADYILSPYVFANNPSDRIYQLPKYYKTKSLFFPHFVDGVPVPTTEKTVDAILTGAVSATYPFRQEASKIEWFHRTEGNKSVVKRQYLEYVARAKIAVTCNSRIGYTVAKYFEIPHAGTLLYAPRPKSTLEMELLGLSNIMEEATESTAADIEARVKKILANPERLVSKSEAGRKLVQSRHTVHNRMWYLRSLLNSITSGRFMIYDQFDLFIDSLHIPA